MIKLLHDGNVIMSYTFLVWYTSSLIKSLYRETTKIGNTEDDQFDHKVCKSIHHMEVESFTYSSNAREVCH